MCIRDRYVLTTKNLVPIDSSSNLACQKVFHVSPFCDVQGRYQFELDERVGQPRLAIDYFDDETEHLPLLRTAIVVKPQPLSVSGLLGALLTMPMMTFGVMLRIHIQAFKLWRQGAKYRSVPSLPKDEITHNFKVHE